MANVRISEDFYRNNPLACRTYIPFASGGIVNLSTRPSGIPGFPAFIGFGCSEISVNYLDGEINLDEELTNYAFPVVKTTKIDSLVASFSNSPINSFGRCSVTVCAQLFYADKNNNIFRPIEETLLKLEPSYNDKLSGAIISFAKKEEINVTLLPGSRILLVFFLKAEKICGATEIEGYPSAGLIII